MSGAGMSFEIRMSQQSPNSSYYSKRYIEGTDRWTNVKNNTTLTVALIKRMGALLLNNKQYQILDIGCGTLWMSRIVAAEFQNVRIHGLDFAYDAILLRYPDLKAELTKYAITFEKADWQSYVSTNKYDVIFDFGLFHHLVPEDWLTYALQIDNYLQPEGSLFIRAFHPTDSTWGKTFPGGHVRNDYYCHYHTLGSLQEIFNKICCEGIEIDICKHSVHIEGLYHFKKISNPEYRI